MLIPAPMHYHQNDGHFCIPFDVHVTIKSTCSENALYPAKQLLRDIQGLGFAPKLTKSLFDVSGCIVLAQQPNIKGYNMVIDANGVLITASADEQLFYGVQTLRQLIRINGASLPYVQIEDYPHFEMRGFYFDVTRGKVPKIETLKKLAEEMAFYKLNQLQLYIEHTYVFQNQSEVWAGNDPLTAEQILELDAYCKQLHIELIPSFATFGHLYHLLDSYSFNHLCELDDNLDRPFTWVRRQHHHTLDVSNPQSIALVKEMIEEVLPLFSSDKFNICCDETFDLGKGKSKPLAEKVGVGKLYIDFVNQIINILKKHGKTAMMWGDVVANHPEVLGDLPKDAIMLCWDYSPNPKEMLSAKVFERGLKQALCPSVLGWNKLMSLFEESYSNITKMADIAVKYQALGILNTDWGDFGNINLHGCSMPGMIVGAAFSWNPQCNISLKEINKEISILRYNDKQGTLLEQLTTLSQCQPIKHHQLVHWLLRQDIQAVVKDTPEEEFHKSTETANHILSTLHLYLIDADDEARKDICEFIICAKGIVLTNALGLIIKKSDLKQDIKTLIEQPKTLAVKFEYWLQEYIKVWRVRNHESELDRIIDFYRRVCKYLRTVSE